MRHAPDVRKFETELVQLFSSEFYPIAKEWLDSQWTDAIHKRLAEMGHRYGYLVFATNKRCPEADGDEWLYDHHWRVSGIENSLIRIPLVMEIEWGRGERDLFEHVTKDFRKLVQARADLRVIVFQGKEVDLVTNKLVAMASEFEGSQQGDRWLFVGYGWDTKVMNCRLWSA